jgi:hypothetical protein
MSRALFLAAFFALLSACSTPPTFQKGDYVLIQPPDREPLGGRIIGTQRQADGLYYRIQADDGQDESFPASQVINKCQSVGDVWSAQMKWERDQLPDGGSMSEKDRYAKKLILLCGVIPLVLMVLANLCDFFAIPLVLYFLVAFLVNPFLFFSVLIFFSVLSSIYLLFACVLLGDLAGWISYVIFLFMMLA